MVVNVDLQHLALAQSRVSHHQDMRVSSDGDTVPLRPLLTPSEQSQRQACLYELITHRQTQTQTQTFSHFKGFVHWPNG